MGSPLRAGHHSSWRLRRRNGTTGLRSAATLFARERLVCAVEASWRTVPLDPVTLEVRQVDLRSPLPGARHRDVARFDDAPSTQLARGTNCDETPPCLRRASCAAQPSVLLDRPIDLDAEPSYSIPVSGLLLPMIGRNRSSSSKSDGLPSPSFISSSYRPSLGVPDAGAPDFFAIARRTSFSRRAPT